jgi:predicted MarR family transcription regulator
VPKTSKKAPARRRVPPGLGSLDRTWHLAHDQHEIELTEFEYAALRMNAAFQRWNEAAIRAAGEPSLTYSEASILHVIRMQDRPKRISVIANLLNRDDIGNLQYSLRKLRSADLIRPAGSRSRKNFEYEVTSLGRDLTDRVAEIAGQLIFASTRELAGVNDKLVAAAGLLRLMTGILDEAARVAATFAPAVGSARAKRRRRDTRGG